MAYKDEIAALGKISFDNIRRVACDYVLALSDEERNALFESLSHGTDLLDSDGQMMLYMYAYGKMHQAKVNRALESLDSSAFTDNDFDIVDWGCGQGLATICFFDFLKSKHLSNRVQNITLIEPSGAAMERAKIHVRACTAKHLNVRCVEKSIDDVSEEDVKSISPVTFHFFSNILDISGIDLKLLAKKVGTNVTGQHYVLCISPMNGGNKRLDRFYEYFNVSKTYLNETRAEYEYSPDSNPCSYNIKVFKLEHNQNNFFSEDVDYAECQCECVQKAQIINGRGVLLNGVTKILLSYFAGRPELVAIDIPDSVTEIEPEAFWGTGLKSIFIPANVSVIGYQAFTGCPNIEQIEVSPDNRFYSSANNCLLTKDGKTLLLGCKNSIIPEGVTNIANWAFSRGCPKSITIPDSVIQIQEQAFGIIEELTSIEVSPHNEKYTSFNNCILSKDGRVLIMGCETSIIPSGVTTIGKGAFSGCRGLEYIKLPESIIEIQDRAFAGCSKLKSIEIPRGVTTIAHLAFSDCSSLRSILFSRGITEIKDFAFHSCSCLTTMELPDTIIKIGHSAFGGCLGISSIQLPNGLISIGSDAFIGCSGLQSVYIPAEVSHIGDGAFAKCSGVRQIEVSTKNSYYFSEDNCCISKTDHRLVFGCGCSSIPNGVTEIEDKAFFGMTDLISVSIPGSVKYIGIDAFSYCTKLSSLNIAEGVECMEEAFRGCIALSSIVIPESVNEILGNPFAGCSKLERIEVAKNNPCYFSLNNSLFCGHKLISGCKNSIIPEGVKKIGACVFYSCTGLKTIQFPESVETIEEYAFYGCTGLLFVNIPKSVKNIGDGAFEECNNIVGMWIKHTNPDDIDLISAFGDKVLASKDLIVPEGSERLYRKRYGTIFRTIDGPPLLISLGRIDHEWSVINVDKFR